MFGGSLFTLTALTSVIFVAFKALMPSILTRRHAADVSEFRCPPVGSPICIGGGLAPASIQRSLSALRALYRHLIRHQGLAGNPAAAVRAPKAGRRLPKAIEG